MHATENNVPPAAVVFRTDYRVVARRVLNYRRKRSPFGNRQLRNLFAEIFFGSRFNSVTPLRKINGVQIHFEYFALGFFLFKLRCALYLRNFPFDSHL